VVAVQAEVEFLAANSKISCFSIPPLFRIP